ncbi:follistatin-related protein 1-like [Dendronephthya gigantea]|uniref:follistatin-related protein 1-like n=1 Tax=Dendronephthya gigantea TaxID=151771 RepID=UPI00106BF169|nr:follistatin-related protein 1-like [Dendronephthya gigantea]
MKIYAFALVICFLYSTTFITAKPFIGGINPYVVCRLNHCDFSHRPVCGSNGQMYVNKCELDYASCKSGGRISWDISGRSCGIQFP